MMFPQCESFFQLISTQYRYEFKLLCKFWININKKICKSSQQLTFLIRCRQYDIFPLHIENARFCFSFRSNTVKHKFGSLKKRFKKMMLNLEIKYINYNLDTLRSRVKRIETDLITHLSRKLMGNFFQFNKKKVTRLNQVTKSSLIKKFNNMLNKRNTYYDSFFNVDKSKWLINISDKVIPDPTKFLNLGERFGLPT